MFQDFSIVVFVTFSTKINYGKCPRTRPILPPENIEVTHFCYRLCLSKDYIAAGMIKPMKISNETLGNRSRDPQSRRKMPKISALRRD